MGYGITLLGLLSIVLWRKHYAKQEKVSSNQKIVARLRAQQELEDTLMRSIK